MKAPSGPRCSSALADDDARSRWRDHCRDIRSCATLLADASAGLLALLPVEGHQYPHGVWVGERSAVCQQDFLVHARQIPPLDGVELPPDAHEEVHVCAVESQLFQCFYERPGKESILLLRLFSIGKCCHLHLQCRLVMSCSGETEGHRCGPRHGRTGWQPTLARVVDLHHRLEAWSRLHGLCLFLLPNISVVGCELHLYRVPLQTAKVVVLKSIDQLPLQGP
mmetsp:Transcript_6286/g.12890  ORF Transcript_6286/g.12890 Transcript_6286/m.12890 type:complete len:223 (+) Transcript_6286:924-1592(+)